MDEWTVHRLTGAPLRALADGRASAGLIRGLTRRANMILCGSAASTRLTCSAGLRQGRARSSGSAGQRRTRHGRDAGRRGDRRRPRRQPRPSPLVVTGLAPGAEVTAEVAIESSPAVTPGTVAARAGNRLRPGRHASAWRPISPSPSPAGSCGWSATSTTTRCGGARRASSSSPGCCCRTTDGELPEVRTAFELVRLHLDAARRDPDYKFVLAELDYLKPHFDAHPEDRADLLELHRRGPDRAGRRQLQRAEHEPDLRRVHHPQRRLRHRLPARRARRRTRARPGCWTRSGSTPAIPASWPRPG